MKNVPNLDCISDASALIIVPPFACLDRPSLAAHVLQSCAAARGHRVGIVYASLLLGREIGPIEYGAISHAVPVGLLGERYFAAAAYGVPLLGRKGANRREYYELGFEEQAGLTPKLLRKLAAGAKEWVERVAAAIVRLNPRVVGATTSFEQTAASIALLNAVKRQNPSIVTILGGANCAGAMAQGIASLGTSIDYIFSGECETAFPGFLDRVAAGDLPEQPILSGSPCANMDAIPTPDYSDYVRQLQATLPDAEMDVWISYETSRGCWWGEKQHCTFCGGIGPDIRYREKSPDRVLSDLQTIANASGQRKILMADNIMPYRYFETLVPRLAESGMDLEIFYEQKSNISLERMVALRRAGIGYIQAGLEALSSSLLRRMKKGVTGRQNIAALRYGWAAGVVVWWNLLCAFPGDELQDYTETLALLPLLHHLNPPLCLTGVTIQRFSPYHSRPEEFGVSGLRPIQSYAEFLPAGADVERYAYDFEGEYASAFREHPKIARALDREVRSWRARAADQAKRPTLQVTDLGGGAFELLDTRGLPDTERRAVLDRQEAFVALVGAPVGERERFARLLAAKVLVELDNALVPLATASVELLREAEADSKTLKLERRLAVVDGRVAHERLEWAHPANL